VNGAGGCFRCEVCYVIYETTISWVCW
jgi:hypothetical protein